MFHPAVREWFDACFDAPTDAQRGAWPAILAGKSTLLLAPTGSGKTLAAFLAAIERLMFAPEPEKKQRLKVLYVSPLKALGVDVEKNLRAPLAGIAATAERRGDAYRVPAIAVRSGDTPPKERARFSREAADILITTPESLYLLLTSNARDVLRSVETVIVDEIHSMVPTKRGAHLFLSLERLEALCGRPLQRIGLSATQRPLAEIARLLAGGAVNGDAWTQRPVEIIDAGSRRAVDLTIEVPVEDMAALGQTTDLVSGPAAAAEQRRSIWPSIHPRLVELVRAHRSTMIFANSRRLAERLAAAMNELAGEEIALAHHGSVAKEQRLAIEDRLKRGTLPAIVATSSLELGIDMGAVDLVIQIEAPPSVASGMQRVGRAGHSVGALPKGVVFPKFRGDLLAAAATAPRMLAGQVEETLYPRNPLDVLAQQIVAAVAMDEWSVDALFDLVRGAAPFAELPRGSFEGVLDMLSGRYPSDEFAGLRARIVWDRVAGTARARQGARSIAVINGGTIPDRGLYGVFLAGAEEGKPVRVGELDEEMVFESRENEVFLLGASAWRIEEITHDRVLVTPAPGQPGKLPFWHGDRPGRPAELGAAVGQLAREIADDPGAARERLQSASKLDELAAQNLIAFVEDQRAATGEVPSDRTIVIERFLDEMGDWRVCVLSPFGARVHAPWATAVTAQIRERTGYDVEVIWSDDGMVYRLPEADAAPDPSLFVPSPDAVEEQVVRALGGTSLFAARFRENAARALLLPRRMPGRRTALWAQRKRAGDLLAVAARYGSFPILLETYRECLRDVFDVPALVELMRRIESQQIRVVVADTRAPSPFAGTLLFSYVANFLYDGDAPLAERRAQALGLDHAQLRELLGAVELRELIDPGVVASLARSLQHLDRMVKSEDALHDLLLALGDLTLEEAGFRAGPAKEWLDRLVNERRALAVRIAGEERFIPSEDAARYRDALGIALPRGLPAAFLEPALDALGDLVSRYARTHTPFHAQAVAARFGIGVGPVRAALERLADRDRVVRYEPEEWCDVEVLRALKRRSLAALRQQIEPVDPAAYARFLLEWQNVARPLAGPDALITVIEQLEGAPLVLSDLESDILPARVRDYRPSDLDLLLATGEVCWRGAEPLGPNDGRVALHFPDRLALLVPPPAPATGELAGVLRELLTTRGALFFHDLVGGTGAFAGDVAKALHELVWAGEITNDTLAPLRSLLAGSAKHDRRHPRRGMRRALLPGTEGRWSLLRRSPATDTERRAALAGVLLDRYGVLVREAAHAENVAGGFSAVYPVLKAMEEAGRARRGWFVAGLGATQFARAGADDRLRALRDASSSPRTVVLASTDPANPYGATVPWPESAERQERAAGARVVIHDGALVGFVARGEQALSTFLPAEEPERGRAARALAGALAELVDSGKRRALLLVRVDGVDPTQSALAPFLLEAGFAPGTRGWLKRAGVPGARRAERSPLPG